MGMDIMPDLIEVARKEVPKGEFILGNILRKKDKLPCYRENGLLHETNPPKSKNEGVGKRH